MYINWIHINIQCKIFGT